MARLKVISTFPCGHKASVDLTDKLLSTFRYTYPRFAESSCDLPNYVRPHLIELWGSAVGYREIKELLQRVHPAKGKVTLNGEYLTCSTK